MTQNSINNSASDLTIDNLFIDGNTISSTDTDGNIIFAPDGTGVVSVTTAPIVPSGDRADSLGSTTNSWDNVYCDGVSFDDGTNVLATYEKSTFTPVLAFGGGSTGIVYGFQLGSYFKIGALVYISIRVDLTSKGTSTGTATITDLPFTSANDGSIQIVTFSNQVTSTPSGGTEFYGRIDPNTNYITLKCCGSGVDADVTNTQFANTSDTRINGFYWVS